MLAFFLFLFFFSSSYNLSTKQGGLEWLERYEIAFAVRMVLGMKLLKPDDCVRIY
jgi:hypothetical protein